MKGVSGEGVTGVRDVWVTSVRVAGVRDVWVTNVRLTGNGCIR